MHRFLWIFLPVILMLFDACKTVPRNKTVPVLYSTFVKDSFEIYIHLPESYNKDSAHYSVIYYMDASLNLGHQVRLISSQTENQENIKNAIFVGVGHWGKYAKLRNRDFIPPVFKNEKAVKSKYKYWSNADAFYQFFNQELIPHINRQYPNNGNKTYIGHSLSALFGLYCLFQEKPLFKNYVILSPSLWANRRNFFMYEKYFHAMHPVLDADLYYACGTREWGNEILFTSRKLHKILVRHPYTGLHYTYVEHPGKGHYGIVPGSLEWVFRNMKF
jgi:predicted alpha/beta superfamily hydrolase